MLNNIIPALVLFLIIAALGATSTMWLARVSIPLDDFKHAIKLCEANNGLAALESTYTSKRFAHCINTATFEFNSGDKIPLTP